MEQSTFQERIMPLKQPMFRFAMHMLHDRAEAEDAVQETLLKLWKSRATLGSIDHLEAWCIRMVKNYCLDQLKSHSRGHYNVDEQLGLVHPEANPDRLLESKESIERLMYWVRHLPEAHREVFSLRDIEGLSYQEIAETLQITLDQVKINLFRARQKLKQVLQNEGTLPHNTGNHG